MTSTSVPPSIIVNPITLESFSLLHGPNGPEDPPDLSLLSSGVVHKITRTIWVLKITPPRFFFWRKPTRTWVKTPRTEVPDSFSFEAFATINLNNPSPRSQISLHEWLENYWYVPAPVKA